MTNETTGFGRWLRGVAAHLNSPWRRSVPPDRIAVLIDGDNIGPKIALRLFADIVRHGDPTVRRVHGNSAGSVARWSNVPVDCTIVRVHSVLAGSGKNDADLQITVDAMDLLHRRQVNAFALVSSDSDLTPIAMRIREEGLAVHGYGYAQTPAPLQSACTTFTSFKNLEQGSTVQPARRWSLEPSNAEAMLVLAILRAGGGNRFVDLQKVAFKLRQDHPNFDPRCIAVEAWVNCLNSYQPSEVIAKHSSKVVRLRLGTPGNQPTSIPR